MDLHEQFSTPVDVDADLGRGRSAPRRRRTGQKVAGAAFAAFAVAAGIAIGIHATPAANVPTAAKDPGTVSTTATRLVAYTGEQPKGYTIDKVPDGWEIQADNADALLLAPKTSVNKDPHSFVGKIGIFLQSKDQAGPGKGTTVKVGNGTGVLVPTIMRLRGHVKKQALGNGGVSAASLLAGNNATDGATLWIKQPSGVYVLIQFWSGLGLNQRDMTDIGAGVHVHKDAVQGVG